MVAGLVLVLVWERDIGVGRVVPGVYMALVNVIAGVAVESGADEVSGLGLAGCLVVMRERLAGRVVLGGRKTVSRDVRLGAWCERRSKIGLLFTSELCQWDACILFHFFPLLNVGVAKSPTSSLTWHVRVGCSVGVMGDVRVRLCGGVRAAVMSGQSSAARWCLCRRHGACVRRWRRVRSDSERVRVSNGDDEHERNAEPTRAAW